MHTFAHQVPSQCTELGEAGGACTEGGLWATIQSVIRPRVDQKEKKEKIGKERKKRKGTIVSNDRPFSPSFGNRPSELVGRDELLSRISEGLTTEPGNRERAIVLLGQRGSGKTVLLWEIADRARKLGYVVANPTTATEGMLGRIIEKVQEDGERRTARGPAAEISSASVGALGFSFGLQFTRDTLETKSFHYKLRSLCTELAARNHGVLVLVDELQANSPDMRQLVGAYQELVGEGIDLAIVLAGLPSAVSGTLNDRALTFLNRATRIDLGPIAIGEIDAYYARAFAELDIRIPTDLRLRAAEATEGSAYLMQLVGHCLTRYARGGRVDEPVLADALRAARADFERDVCETSLAALSDMDAAFLSAMSKDDGRSKTSEVAERLGVTRDYAQKYRKRLLDAGIIRVTGHGSVGFAVPYLRDWLRAND